MSREDRRQRDLEVRNAEARAAIASAPVVILSEAIEATEDDLDAIEDRIIQNLEDMLALMKKQREERRNEKPK